MGAGRWRGKLTSRDLPCEDPSIDALSREQRIEVSAHWLERAAFERRVGDAFFVIHTALLESRAADPLLSLAERGMDDERRHAEIARVVASRFAGEELQLPAPLPLVVPRHTTASEELRRTLHVFGHCALNETFASAVLEASLAVAEGPLARAALRELLSDEVDHARIGWGMLAALDQEMRARVAPWVFELVRTNLRQWRDTKRQYVHDPVLVGQGALSRELLETALLTALRELIEPGLAHVGLCTLELQGWLEGGAPTAATS